MAEMTLLKHEIEGGPKNCDTRAQKIFRRPFPGASLRGATLGSRAADRGWAGLSICGCLCHFGGSRGAARRVCLCEDRQGADNWGAWARSGVMGSARPRAKRGQRQREFGPRRREIFAAVLRHLRLDEVASAWNDGATELTIAARIERALDCDSRFADVLLPGIESVAAFAAVGVLRADGFNEGRCERL